MNAKGQTTIPNDIWQPLGVDHFLEFLARDMLENPGTAIAPLTGSVRDQMVALVGNMEICPDGAIDGPVFL